MSTSANVTHFKVTTKSTGQVVGQYSQHHFCKNTVKDKLKQHTPPENFNIEVTWPDEDEVVQHIFSGALDVWVRRQEELDLVGAAHARAAAKTPVKPVECDCLGDWHTAETAKTWPENSIVLIRYPDREADTFAGLHINRAFSPKAIGAGTGFGVETSLFMLIKRGKE